MKDIAAMESSALSEVEEEGDGKIQELYSGGRAKELIWIAYLDDACYNKPIETA